MIVELNLDKETVFVLEMEIEGNTGEKPELRFCIQFDNYTLALTGKKIEEGMYEITCPKLKGITPIGSYAANVEVYLGDKRFVPLKETVKVKQEIKPVVKISESKLPLAGPTINIKPASKPIIIKTTETIRK